MRSSSLDSQLSGYERAYPGERAVVERFRTLLGTAPGCFERSCMPGHITASAWVLSPDRRSVLLVHHRKMDCWLQPGGHADGDPCLASVARRDVAEETGLAELDSLGDETSPVPFDLGIHVILPHGETPEHLHYDVRFAFVARSWELVPCEAEIKAARWVGLDDLAPFTEEAEIHRMANKYGSLRA